MNLKNNATRYKHARCLPFALALAALFVCLSFGKSFAVEMKDYPVVKLQSLDKTTARTGTFEANVGSTVKFGSLFIKVQACRKTPPIGQPESAAFLQVWEVNKDEEAEWTFSGWMFASSPGLSSMDHPVYDVWVLDCQKKKGTLTKEMKKELKSGEGEISDEAVPAQPDIKAEPAENEKEKAAE